ncbi:hypothetical protein [Rathayibacter sp. AY1B5]|uniref:hypothetical protein n=1 Tax=Rathayibacter sp. AY1B5 TaxID=2080530 RepID=UPI0011AFDFF5|nr:hypothetical protein [Rathayibacter sp. AY1B5]
MLPLVIDVNVFDSALDVWLLVATLFAAVATAVSAVVIAVQALDTRKSARASLAAVELSQQALAQAERARLDASTPRTYLSVPPRLSYQLAEIVDGQRIDSDNTDEFREKRDDERTLSFDCVIEARNDGPGSARLEFSSVVRDYTHGGSPLHQVLLSPGEAIQIGVPMTLSFSEWISMYEDTATQETRDKLKFRATYTGPGDTDVDVVHVVETKGSIVKPEGISASIWLFDPSGITVNLLPSTRQYWYSRQGLQRMAPVLANHGTTKETKEKRRRGEVADQLTQKVTSHSAE